MFPIASLEVEGGGRLGVCPLPGASGDLEGDLEIIARWCPDIVVSLTERAEMEAAAAGHLGARLQKLCIAWLHLPIRDFDTPDDIGGRNWRGVRDRLHACLDGKGAVLLHCRGGKGRSGMIALRLLIERGEAPQSALERLRTERPGAVETPAQEVWAARGVHAPRRESRGFPGLRICGSNPQAS